MYRQAEVVPRIGALFIAFASLGYAAVQFLQIVWVSTQYGADALGGVGLVLGFFSPVLSFLSAGQRFSVLTSPVAEPAANFAHSLLRGIAIFFLLLGALLYSFLWGDGVYVAPGVVVAIGLYKLIDAFFELEMWRAQVRGDRAAFLGCVLGRVFGIPFSCALSFFVGLSLRQYLWVSVLCITPFLIFLERDFSSFRCGAFGRNWELSRVVNALRQIFPVGLAAGVESLTVTLPRYFLAVSGALADVAFFTLFTQISVAFGVIASSRLQSNMPQYAALSKLRNGAEKSLLMRSVLVLSLIVFFIGGLVVFAPESIVRNLFGSWFIAKNELLFMLPVLSGIWYVGGYVSNVTAVFFGKRFLLNMSLVMLFLVATGVFAGTFLFSNLLYVCIASLFVAFSFRLVFSLVFFLRCLSVGGV